MQTRTEGIPIFRPMREPWCFDCGVFPRYWPLASACCGLHSAFGRTGKTMPNKRNSGNIGRMGRVGFAKLKPRLCSPFQPSQIRQRFSLAVPAHLHGRLKPRTTGWPSGIGENDATQIIGQLHTAHAARFTVRHPWNGCGDGQGNATSTTTGPAVHRPIPVEVKS